MIHSSSYVYTCLKELEALVYKYYKEELGSEHPSRADVESLITQTARYTHYTDGFWKIICLPIAQGWIEYVEKNAKSTIDWIKSGGNFTDNKGNVIGLPHLFATIEGYGSSVFIALARKEWAGWMGDLAQVTCQVLSEIDPKYYEDYDYLISYSTKLIGNDSSISSFSSNDIYCDIDGENIYYMLGEIGIVEAFNSYYNTNNKYLSRFDIFITKMSEGNAFYQIMAGPNEVIFNFIDYNGQKFSPTKMQRSAVNGTFANYVLTRQFKTN